MGRKKLSKHAVIITVSVPEEIRTYLRTKENYSQYICELIENDRITASDLDDIDFDKEKDKSQLKAILKRLFGE